MYNLRVVLALVSHAFYPQTYEKGIITHATELLLMKPSLHALVFSFPVSFTKTKKKTYRGRGGHKYHPAQYISQMILYQKVFSWYYNYITLETN
jgi:hypothetical protein